MKFLSPAFLLFFSCLVTLAEPLGETQINARIAANQKVKDDPIAVEAAKLWEDALSALKGANDSLLAEKKIRADLAKLAVSSKLTPPAMLPPKASLAEQEALLEKVTQLIEQNTARLKELADTAAQSPKLVADLIEQSAATRAELIDLKIPPNGVSELQVARREKALQDQRLLQAKIDEIAARQEFLRRETDLFPTRGKKRQDYETELKKMALNLQAIITDLTEQLAKETRTKIAALDEEFSNIPGLSEIVDEVNELRTRRDSLVESLTNAKQYDAEISQIRTNIRNQFKSAHRRITLLEEAKLGVDDETGMLLRKQRSRLPSVDEISDELRANLERAAKAEIALIGLTDLSKSPPQLADEFVDKILRDYPAVTRTRIDELLSQRSDSVRALAEDYRKLITELTKGTEATKTTIAEIEEYTAYIDERLLWIKSTKPITLRSPPAEWQRILELFSHETLGNVWQSIQSRWSARIIGTALAFLSALAIVLRRRRLRAILKESSRAASRRNCVTLAPTLKYIGAAFLLALWFPLLLFVASNIIEEPYSWRIGLFRLSNFLFLCGLVLKFSRPDGLFVSHFRIHRDRSALFYRNLKWFMPIAAPFVFLVPALTNNDGPAASGRVVYILASLVSLGFCHHLFHPKRSILQNEGKGTNLTKFFYLIIMLVPLTLGLGAAVGYFASVLTLNDQLGATAALLLFAFFVHRFLLRWTLVSRRHLAVTQVLRRREASQAERERQAEGADKHADIASAEEVKAGSVNVVEVEEQTTQLLKLAIYAAVFFGFWAIWSSTLPALSFLDKVTLWGTETVTTSEPATSLSLPGVTTPAAPTSAGDAASSTAAKGVTTLDGRVSLENLLLSIVFFALTVIAARNIPGLLSLTLFNRINLGPGGNFALTTTVRYLIVMVGIVLALAQIEITWGKVQWLAAAVTLGIGFGLQEIFANFVAGIIMLFERPVRLGDVVTVGEISGKVTQIKIRATTIQQFNNRELLVPNKEFITSQLVNWTLKDSVLRFEVGVGIAYGSDTEKATRILNEIVNNHPNIIAEPGPDVLFQRFGNSTLDFQVRGFVGGVEHLLSTQSELHYLIDQAFREAEIEIAFPQQDIHIRSLPEGLTFSQKP